MSFRNRFAGALNAVLGRFDTALVRKSRMDEFLRASELAARPSHATAPLPDGAADYLRRDHPRLAELRERYRALGGAIVERSTWSDELLRSEVDLGGFRGDNAYVWQFRDRNSEVNFLLAAYYARSIDRLGLLDRCTEDGLFGAYTFEVGEGLRVSRDLLDSVLEIHFLERHLGLSQRAGVRVLDIGAGYGRLAHRLATGLPALGACLCVDAVAESTFVSEYYLRFRGVGDRARVVPLDEIDAALEREPVDLAVNVHSWSECTLGAVEWWLDLLARHRVRHLMIVPNSEDHGGTRLTSIEPDRSHRDVLPALGARGYRQLACEPKYLDPAVQRHGVSPTRHWLFELGGADR